jgi:hypothetical protein
LKENVDKTAKISTDSRSLESAQWSRGVLSFFCDSRALEKGDPDRAHCGAPGEFHLVHECARFCREAVLSLNSKDLIVAQR